MKSRKQKQKPKPEPGAQPRSTRLWERLATTNLLFLLPLLFLVGTLALWQWSSGVERERIRTLTAEEAQRIATELSEHLQGQAEDSTRRGNSWVMRAPEDQTEWEMDLARRRWVYPELETVEWIDAEMTPLMWPNELEPEVGRLLSAEDLVYPRGVLHYARGMALAATGRGAEATAELEQLLALRQEWSDSELYFLSGARPEQLLEIGARASCGLRDSAPIRGTRSYTPACAGTSGEIARR